MRNLILLILFIPFIVFSQTGKIRGTVTDGKSPIPSVNIVLLDTDFGEATDLSGQYEFKAVPAGNYEIRFSAVGYETQNLKITVYPGRTYELNVMLQQTAIEIETVEVTGNAGQDQRDTRTSLIDLNPRDAKVMPGAAEDVFRTLQALPGVLAPNDFSSQLIIRGSGPDQNLIIMDDVEIFNPYRLYGVISMFNPDAVEDVNLISGGFPAKYGDRLSAVLDVTNREGSRTQTLTGSVNASIVEANLVLEGKNPFNLKGGWLFNSRRTYYDLVIEPFVKNAGLVDDNTSFPNFYDFQGKIAIGPYDGHKLLFSGIVSRDGVDVVSGSERKTPDSVSVYNVTRNDLVSGAWHFTPNKRLLNKFIVSWYKNKGTTDFDSEILDPSLNRNAFENTIPDTLSPYLLNFKFNADFSYLKYSIDDKLSYFLDNHIIEAGIGADFMQTIIDFKFELDPELAAILASNPQFRAALSDLRDVKDYNRYRAYVQDNIKVSQKLTLQPSLRFDYYNILANGYTAPRLSMSYAINDLTTVRAVWGMYYQSPGYEKFLDQGVIYDLSERYTKKLSAERAIHYVLGIERWLSPEWNARIEGYYKDFDKLYIQQIVQGNRFVAEQIPGADPRYSSGWTLPATVYGDSLTQIPINGSYGEAYGFEFMLAKKNILAGSKLSGWLSYALAFAHRYENGIEYPFRFDQRNTVNVVLNYEMNSWLDVGIRWQYGSGFPISEPLGIKPRIILEDQDFDGIPETPVISTRKNSSDPNAPEVVIYDVDFGDRKLNSRKPEYHRLDVRFNAKAGWWGLNWIIYLDIVNVYNHGNVIGYDYFVTDDLQLGRETTTMLPILPTLGFSVRF
jgi:hypothetical protein